MGENKIPLAILAFDAFGKKDLEEFYPDWEFQNDLTVEDFRRVAAKSKRVFATDGESLFPGNPLRHLKDHFSFYPAEKALEIFGLPALAESMERGVAALSPRAISRHKEHLSLQSKAREPNLQQVTPKSGRPARKASETHPMLKARILAILRAAGDEGVAVKELSSKLGVTQQDISVWFSSTGKKIGVVKKVGASGLKYP